MKRDYEDIIHLEHHVSATRPQMPVQDRAAQFSPFAALTGYGDAIGEAARVTEEKIELDEYEREDINEKLREITTHPEREFEVDVTFFLPDERKRGGKYVNLTGIVKKIDEYSQCIVLCDRSRILIEDVLRIEFIKRE